MLCSDALKRLGDRPMTPLFEQDHRAIKRRVRPMLGFKTMNSARITLSWIEMIHPMRKQQAVYAGNPQPSLAE